MPDKVIDIPGIGPTAFPDSMAPDAINAAAAKLYADANPKHPPVDPKHSWIDTATDWLPAAGGAVGGLLGAGAGPLGALGGAAVLGAGGEAAKQLINRARGQDAPATPGAAAASIAKQGGLNAAAEGGGQLIGAGMSYVAPKLMQSAVKPTLEMMKDHPVGQLVKTLLDDGVSVTQSGVDKLQRLLMATSDQISEAVGRSSGRINVGNVVDRLGDVSSRVMNQVNPTKDLKAVEAAGEEFLNHPRLVGAKDMSVQTAQDLKVGTYQQLKGKYGEMSSASAEAQKALARGLKEELEQEVPGIGALNERSSDLMAALDAVGRRVAFSGNRDPIGFAWVTHHPGQFVAALMDKSPAVKSLIARGLYQSAGNAARVAPQLIRAAVTALATTDAPTKETP